MNLVGKWVPEERADRWLILLACLFILLTGYSLFFYQQTVGLSGDAVLIGTIQSDGPIRFRHARTLVWGVSQSDTDVFLRDTIYTPKGTTAEFQWNDKKFFLEPESLVQFDEASLDKLEITLMEGKIRVDPKDAGALTISKPVADSIFKFKEGEIGYIPDINPLIIKHSELSSRTVDSLNKKLDLEPPRAVIVPKLFLNQLADYKVVLQSPESGEFRFDGRSLFNFSWKSIPLPNIEYFLHISDASNFKNSLTHSSRLQQLDILFDQPGEYWWKISARWRREEIESSSRKAAFLKQGENKIPERALTTTSKSLSEASNQNKKVLGIETLRPTVKKSPYEILFGK